MGCCCMGMVLQHYSLSQSEQDDCGEQDGREKEFRTALLSGGAMSPNFTINKTKKTFVNFMQEGSLGSSAQ